MGNEIERLHCEIPCNKFEREPTQTTLVSSVEDQTTLVSSGKDQTTLVSGGEDQTTLVSSVEDQTTLVSSGKDQTTLDSSGDSGHLDIVELVRFWSPAVESPSSSLVSPSSSLVSSGELVDCREARAARVYC
jgi:hypothetical protein